MFNFQFPNIHSFTCIFAIFIKNKMAEFPDDADKKKRSSNWDSAEMTMLQQLVNDNITVIRSKLTNSITNSKKNGIWKDISSKINALGLHSRSDKEVKTKWQNLQTKAKKEYAESKKYIEPKLAVALLQNRDREYRGNDIGLFKFCWFKRKRVFDSHNKH